MKSFYLFCIIFAIILQSTIQFTFKNNLLKTSSLTLSKVKSNLKISNSFSTLSSTSSSSSLVLPTPFEKKKIFVLGGDGFCGWPTSLHLSAKGHDVIIIDNFSRRKIDIDLGTESLTPITSLEERIKAWNLISSDKKQKALEESLSPSSSTSSGIITSYQLDLSKDYYEFLTLLKQEKPDTIIHLAEQRSAPYSMKNSKNKRYTVENNLAVTNNILNAIVDSSLDIHLVHLGTMGVYGYGGGNEVPAPSFSTSSPSLTNSLTKLSNLTEDEEKKFSKIPEGYLTVKYPNDKYYNILHPANPGSVYHLTKCLDALLFQYYTKNDHLQITDLHQGIVWGTNTPLSNLDQSLINRFDYDSDYGTVLNRFLMQAALNIPLTVYGTGGQTRAFVHIRDTCRCIEAAVMNPPRKKKSQNQENTAFSCPSTSSSPNVEIFNQVSESLNVKDLALLVASLTNAKISYLSNPRQELLANELEVSNEKFKKLGLNDLITLSNSSTESGSTSGSHHLLNEVTKISQKYSDRCNKLKVAPSSFWNKERKDAASSSY